jgi:hypothetical protein
MNCDVGPQNNQPVFSSPDHYQQPAEDGGTFHEEMVMKRAFWPQNGALRSVDILLDIDAKGPLMPKKGKDATSPSSYYLKKKKVVAPDVFSCSPASPLQALRSELGLLSRSLSMQTCVPQERDERDELSSVESSSQHSTGGASTGDHDCLTYDVVEFVSEDDDSFGEDDDDDDDTSVSLGMKDSLHLSSNMRVPMSSTRPSVFARDDDDDDDDDTSVSLGMKDSLHLPRNMKVPLSSTRPSVFACSSLLSD